jgi:hypothetical protein
MKNVKSCFKHDINCMNTILSFNLINELFSFQNFINDILHNFLNIFYMIYMNDILIYSNSKKKHTQHV